MSSRSTSEIAKQIGQLLVIGFEPAEMTAQLRALLARVQPAGVILFARNIVSGEQTHRLLKDCQACLTTRMLACVDLEGGRVDRFRSVLGPAPSAADVFATGDPSAFRRHGKLIGESCRALGFNVDFAPVLDLALDASREVMSSRAVSADPGQVIAYARGFLRGLESAGVVGCGKHFPGLGEANLDTHHELPSVKKSLAAMWKADLVPYRTLSRELPMVLVGHANYPQVTRDDSPASLSSRWITEVLRNRIGYRGLVVSDDMEMGGVLKAASMGEAAVEFVRAGGDVCLVCRKQDYVLESWEALMKQAARDRRFSSRVKDSVRRMLRFKEKSKKLLRRGPTPSTMKLQRLTRQLWEFGEQVRLEALR